LGITSQEDTVNEHTDNTTSAGADNQADEEQELRTLMSLAVSHAYAI